MSGAPTTGARAALLVGAADAERAIRLLHEARALDPTRKTRREGETVLIPVRDAAARTLLGDIAARVTDDASPVPREERVAPHAQVLARLPPALRVLAPDRWELVGDVLVLRLAPDVGAAEARELAAAYADVLGAKCVVRDAAGVAGELREMQGELLLGDDPVATHRENGVRFRLDASRVMFSSGNTAERQRAARIACAGETVVDMFAGVGYFTLPIAVHARPPPARIHALEKNPLSFRYLQEGIEINGVGHLVEPWLGDNRDFPHHGIADRVLMGYFPGTAAFLPTAFQILRPEGGRIHYHDTAHERTWKEEMTRAFLDAARACGRVVAIEEARVVKSHSPGVVHAVLIGRVRG